jgi:hypothetical protein
MGKKEKLLHDTWNAMKGKLGDQLKAKGKYPRNLYNLQIWTNLLLDYAFRRQDEPKNIQIMEELANLFIIPFGSDFLTKTGKYLFYTGGTNKYTELNLPSPSPMWLKEVDGRMLEIVLDSSQFLYLVAHAIHCFVSLPKHSFKNSMKTFVRKCTPVVLDHYNRWIFASSNSTDISNSIGIFQVRALGCGHGRYNHREHLENKLQRAYVKGDSPPHCNAVQDVDMWILCGAIELLAAQKKKRDLFSLDAELEEKYLEYFDVGCRLIESRLEPKGIKNFEGKTVQGINFDPGAWQKHKDYVHAGFTDKNLSNFTKESFPVPAAISWDISHARRFVQVFETLYHNRSITRQVFPTKDVLQGLANQASFTVFKKDLKKPLFTNYFDGSNGWYRVKGNKGIGPDQNSAEWIAGGFALWQLYQPALKRVVDAIWEMIESTTDSTTPAIDTFKDKNYKPVFLDFGRKKPGVPHKPKSSPYLLNLAAAALMPDIPEESSKMTLSTKQLNFGTRKGDSRPLSQTVTISSSGKGTLVWQAKSNTHWLTCSPASGVGDGEITVTVSAGQLQPGKQSETGKVTLISSASKEPAPTISVTLNVISKNTKIKFTGAIDTPKDNQKANGSIPVNGWAVGEIQVKTVKVFRKEGNKLIFIGDAAPFDDPRLDVVEKHSHFPNVHRPAWGYMLLTNTLPNKGNGTFELVVKARSESGDEEIIGTRTIICDNANAVKPFGAIDRPKPFDTVSGTFRIHGWVLTHPRNKIPEDGSTIKVKLDNQTVGTATYNLKSEQIAEIFPECKNKKNARAFFDLNTKELENGNHELQWVVTDDAGNQEGIGSRIFKVKN